MSSTPTSTSIFKSLLHSLSEQLSSKYDEENKYNEIKHKSELELNSKELNQIKQDLIVSKSLGTKLIKTIHSLDIDNKQLKAELNDIKSKSMLLREKIISKIGSFLRESRKSTAYKKRIQELEEKLRSREQAYDDLHEKYSLYSQSVNRINQSHSSSSNSSSPSSTPSRITSSSPPTAKIVTNSFHTAHLTEVNSNNDPTNDEEGDNCYNDKISTKPRIELQSTNTFTLPAETISDSTSTIIDKTSTTTTAIAINTANVPFIFVDHFIQLNDIITLNIFSFLQTYHILSLAQTCRMMYKRVDQLFGMESKLVQESWDEEYKLHKFFLTGHDHPNNNGNDSNNSSSNSNSNSNRNRNRIHSDDGNDDLEKESVSSSVSSSKQPTFNIYGSSSSGSGNGASATHTKQQLQSPATPTAASSALTSLVSLLSASSTRLAQTTAGVSLQSLTSSNHSTASAQSTAATAPMSTTTRPPLTPMNSTRNTTINSNIKSTPLSALGSLGFSLTGGTATIGHSPLSLSADTTAGVTLTKEVSDSLAKKLNTSEMKAIIALSDTLRRQETLLAVTRDETDDLLSKLKNTETVRDFLVQKLHSAEQALKHSLSDLSTMRSQAAADQEVLSYLDIRGQEYESEKQVLMRDLERLRVLFDLQSGKNDNMERQLLADVNEYRAQLAEQETTYTTHKRILAKEIRSLRVQLERSNTERCVYKAQIQALRDALLTATDTATITATATINMGESGGSSSGVITNDMIY